MASFYLYIIKKRLFCQPFFRSFQSWRQSYSFLLISSFSMIHLYSFIIFLFYKTANGQMTSVLIWLYLLSKTFLKIYVHIYKYIVHDKKGHFILSFWYLPACNWPILKQKYSQLCTFCDIISRFQIFRQY